MIRSLPRASHVLIATALFALLPAGSARADDDAVFWGDGLVDGPMFTFRADLWGQPGSVPTGIFGFGLVGVGGTFKGGVSGFVAPTIVGAYLGVEGLFGGFKRVKADLTVGGEGLAGVFRVVPEDAFFGGLAGGVFGGVFELIHTPDPSENVHVGFRIGARVFVSGFAGPTPAPNLAFTLYAG